MKNGIIYYKVFHFYYWKVLDNNEQIGHSDRSFESEQNAEQNWAQLQSLKDNKGDTFLSYL
jgi:hypothetical protein